MRQEGTDVVIRRELITQEITKSKQKLELDKDRGPKTDQNSRPSNLISISLLEWNCITTGIIPVKYKNEKKIKHKNTKRPKQKPSSLRHQNFTHQNWRLLVAFGPETAVFITILLTLTSDSDFHPGPMDTEISINSQNCLTILLKTMRCSELSQFCTDEHYSLPLRNSDALRYSFYTQSCY